MPKLRADLVTVSHEAPGHSAASSAVKGEPKVLNRPGEYEVKGVFITGIQTWSGGGAKGEAKEENTVFVFEFGDLTVCHLGDLSKVLTQAQVESMPDVDVLMVPVGGGGALDADKAAEVISQLEPRIVIPMHYQTQFCTLKLDSLSKFLKEMGVDGACATGFAAAVAGPAARGDAGGGAGVQTGVTMGQTTIAARRGAYVLLAALVLLAGCSSAGPTTPQSIQATIPAPRSAGTPLTGDPAKELANGQAALAAGNLTEAEKAFRNAAALDARSAQAQFGLGNVFVRQQRFSEAEAAYRTRSRSIPS